MRISTRIVIAAVGIGVGVALLPTSPVSAAGADSISSQRATVREYPGRLVLANALAGDKAEVTGYCGSWVRIRLSPRHPMATPVGWVLRGNLTRAAKKGGLDGVPEACGTDGDRWRDWVGAINAPFHSLRKVSEASGSDNREAARDRRPGAGVPQNTAGKWRRIAFGTGVTLAARPECVLSLNYTRKDNGPDQVDPAQRVTGLDPNRVAYRYVTKDGSVALISAARVGASYGVWGFVPAGCLVPKGRATVYFDEPVVQLRNIAGLKLGVGYSDAVIRPRGCSAAVRSPSQPRFGYWPDPVSLPHCPV